MSIVHLTFTEKKRVQRNIVSNTEPIEAAMLKTKINFPNSHAGFNHAQSIMSLLQDETTQPENGECSYRKVDPIVWNMVGGGMITYLNTYYCIITKKGEVPVFLHIPDSLARGLWRNLRQT